MLGTGRFAPAAPGASAGARLPATELQAGTTLAAELEAGTSFAGAWLPATELQAGTSFAAELQAGTSSAVARLPVYYDIVINGNARLDLRECAGNRSLRPPLHLRKAYRCIMTLSSTVAVADLGKETTCK